jgi:hypothetical protein
MGFHHRWRRPRGTGAKPHARQRHEWHRAGHREHPENYPSPSLPVQNQLATQDTDNTEKDRWRKKQHGR